MKHLRSKRNKTERVFNHWKKLLWWLMVKNRSIYNGNGFETGSESCLAGEEQRKSVNSSAVGDVLWSHKDSWKCSFSPLVISEYSTQKPLQDISASPPHWIPMLVSKILREGDSASLCVRRFIAKSLRLQLFMFLHCMWNCQLLLSSVCFQSNEACRNLASAVSDMWNLTYLGNATMLVFVTSNGIIFESPLLFNSVPSMQVCNV